MGKERIAHWRERVTFILLFLSQERGLQWREGLAGLHGRVEGEGRRKA